MPPLFAQIVSINYVKKSLLHLISVPKPLATYVVKYEYHTTYTEEQTQAKSRVSVPEPMTKPPVKVVAEQTKRVL